MDPTKYPDDWKWIAFCVKDAAGWKCQVCGKKCYIPGEKVIDTRMVLTVAHINHVEMDCRPENLLAACSVCHLKYDAERKRWQRLALKRIASELSLVLFTKKEG
jgi:hypothetical protein